MTDCVPDQAPCEFDSEDGIVCFCYRQSAKQLKEAHAKYGSLPVLQEKTRAGTACGGCRITLQALFNEQPSDINQIDHQPTVGTACSKPGSRIMKGFIIANGDLESTVHSSNGVAPQLGNCDTTNLMKYKLLDNFGKEVLQGEKLVHTNETFIFESKDLDLPRPFYGMFLLELARSNFGGARFNIHWSNSKSSTATHENSSTGRPLVTMPAIFEKDSLMANNEVFFALLNPHERSQNYMITSFDMDSGESYCWESSLKPNESAWLDVSENILKQAFERKPKARLVLRVSTSTLDQHGAITTYFFFHNRKSDIWTSNHL